MSTFVTINLHHYGDFTSAPNMEYIGGRVDVCPGFDTDLLSFRDLEEFAEKYDYDPNCIVCFKRNGKTFEQDITVVYDDSTVRELVELYKPYKTIDLYVDHFTLNDAFDEIPDTPKHNKNIAAEIGENGDDSDNYDDDSNDSDYEYDMETETEDSYNGSLDTEHPEIDEELEKIRRVKKGFQNKMKMAMSKPNVNYEESDFSTEGIWSESSSSEDENARNGYVGPANPKKRRRKRSYKYNGESDGIRWEVGQKFASMAEFRDTVRKYGIDERRPI